MQNTESPSPIISVVVCTYNRADLLNGALETLSAQTLEDSYYEVIVVDNNSFDNTKDFVKEYCAKHQNFRYFLEEKQGLSFARNRGWQEARGEYVAYIDDDCRVPEQWLGVAKNIIADISPAIFGGPFYAFYNVSKPLWFKDAYGSHEPFKEARILTGKEGEKIFGGNMFFYRPVLVKADGFDTNMGMTGKKIAYGEETALIIRIAKEIPNQFFYFDPALFVYHLVREEKMKMMRIIRERFALGRYTLILTDDVESPTYSQGDMLMQAFRQLFRLIGDLLHGIIKRDRSQYPYIQNYLYERTIHRYVWKLGKIYEMYKQIQP